MGACFSKKKSTGKNPTPINPHFPGSHAAPKSDPHYTQVNTKEPPSPPPPPPLEEETVKEMLSETPLPAPLPLPEVEKFEKKPVTVHDEISNSEVSEIYSVSESVSTVTITEKKGEEEVEQRASKENDSQAKFRRKRSFSGEFPVRRERGGKSPARRSDPSPVRRPAGGDLHQPALRSRISNSTGFRRDSGDNSGRRSRSPVPRTNQPGAVRSPTAKRTGKSPRRVPAISPDEDSRKVAEETKDEPLPTGNESVENPLVSLECFIFL